MEQTKQCCDSCIRLDAYNIHKPPQCGDESCLCHASQNKQFCGTCDKPIEKIGVLSPTTDKTKQQRCLECAEKDLFLKTKPQEQNWEIEFDLSFDYLWQYTDEQQTTQHEAVKSFIRSLLQKVRAEIKQEFVEGKRCLTCGKKKENNLTDMCENCLEND